MSDDEKKDAVLYVSDLPPKLKAEFKAKCAMAGVSMREAVERLMGLVVSDDFKFAGKGNRDEKDHQDG